MEKIAIFNNTIVDVGKSAIILTDSPGAGTCERVLRDILIFNNIILGQRNDPTAEFVTYFNSGNKVTNSKGVKQNEPLPHNPTKSTEKLQEPAVLGLIDINAADVYDGSSGILLFCNAIGRRGSDLRAISDLDWGGTYANGTGNVEELLINIFYRFCHDLPYLDETFAHALELPRWARFASVKYTANGSKVYGIGASFLSQMARPFATDWAIHLPTPFDGFSYRWAAVNQLNYQVPLKSVADWPPAAVGKAGWGPLGGENTLVYGVKASLKVFDDAQALIAADNGAPIGMPTAAWIPLDLPPVTLTSSVAKQLPTSDLAAKYPLVEKYLATAKDLGGMDLTLAGFKGARYVEPAPADKPDLSGFNPKFP